MTKLALLGAAALLSAAVAAPAAITPAVDCEKACQPLALAAPSVGGYSLAIPISLITRSYFAS
jgi:hypothetical protein